jgi:hypothetical protein
MGVNSGVLQAVASCFVAMEKLQDLKLGTSDRGLRSLYLFGGSVVTDNQPRSQTTSHC